MMQRDWIDSSIVQPDNGRPVWILEQFVPCPEAGAPLGLLEAVFEWVEFGEFPFLWRTQHKGYFVGHLLWQMKQPRVTPEPPPVPTLPDIKPILAHERPLE